MDPGFGDSAWRGPERLAALLQESRVLRQSAAEARARARVTRDQARQGRSQREISHDSRYARLQARVASLPVIEQAKGVIMAQRGCEPEEAFDLLRQISQRTNVKVSALAAQIVTAVAAGNDGDNVTPITVGARKYLRSGWARARQSPGNRD